MQCGFGKCDSCYQCACDSRPSGFGFYSPSSNGESGALNAIGSAANAIVPGASLLTSLVSTIGRLFGAAPRGDLQKFQRTVYPFMRTLAGKTGIPVYCLWFGDVVGVESDGSYGISIPNVYGGTAGAIRSIDAAGIGVYYYATCPRSDDDCVNNPTDVVFELHDIYGVLSGVDESVTTGELPSLPAGGGVPSQAGLFPSSGSGVNILLMGGAAIALIMFTRSRGR